MIQKIGNIWLAFIAAISAIFGMIYSVCNVDSHHWGFVAGTALDYLHGKKFFSDIYVQYGVGEPLLFKLLSPVVGIDYTSIGVLTSLAYSLNLVLIYLNVKKLSSTPFAVLISALAILLHTYAIFPWPDYYAGVFISLACYLIIGEGKEKQFLRFALAGLCLFLAFIFRNTYLFGFIATAISYAGIAMLNRGTWNKNLVVMIATLFSLVLAYLVFLISQGTLLSWYHQITGASMYSFGLSSLIAPIRNAFFPPKFYLPNNIVLTTLSALLYLSLSVSLRAFRSKELKGTTVFFALLGLSGLIQTTAIYDVFRIQNASSSLYLVLAIVLHSRYPNFFQTQLKKRWLQVALAYFFLLLILKIPHASTYNPVYSGELQSYSKSDIRFFGEHRFQEDRLKYYEELSRTLCDGKRKIVNLTMDSTIPYLCVDQENALALPFYMEPLLASVDPVKLERVKTGDFNSDEVIVSSAPVASNPKVTLTLIKQITGPVVNGYSGTISIFYAERKEP